MLKRKSSPYVSGRPKGHWWKWKRAALTVDCVLMYAQRGSGKRSSFYSDYTFGCWDGDPDDIENGGAELLPVGKAYFGFTDEELKWLDRYVRNHTVKSFGPVRETDKSLVFEVAFDSVHASKRHKSGLAMRFPRISRIRADKPAHEADRIETLRGLIRD
jgi:DNA ligase-1